jgi:DNA-binding transcriptional LysR family regulator
MIDLGALRSLIAVRDHGSIVAAAAALDFTPSAVSQQIKKLERQSRSPMLERVGRSVILTERGRLLAERGSTVLADLEQVENLAAGSGPLRGTLRLAAFSSADRGLVAPLLVRLQHSAPELEVTVHETDPREAVVVVERGGADLALVHDWSTLPLNIPATLTGCVLLTDEADVLVHESHRLADADVVDTTELLAERWVSTQPGSICHEWLVQMFAMHGARPDIRYFDGDYSSHAVMVGHGVAVALMPRLGRVLLPDPVRVVPVTNPTPKRQVSSIWRCASSDNPARRHVQAELELVVAAGG